MEKEAFIKKWCKATPSSEITKAFVADLAAIRRAVIEECAKVAQNHVGNILTVYDGKLPFVFITRVGITDADRDASLAQYIAEQIAQAIRRLGET